jgi:hypothetical protein
MNSKHSIFRKNFHNLLSKLSPKLLFQLSKASYFSGRIHFPDNDFPDNDFPDSDFPDSDFPDSYFPDRSLSRQMTFPTTTFPTNDFPDKPVNLYKLYRKLTHSRDRSINSLDRSINSRDQLIHSRYQLMAIRGIRTPGEPDISLIWSLRAILLLMCEWSVIRQKLSQI